MVGWGSYKNVWKIDILNISMNTSEYVYFGKLYNIEAYVPVLFVGQENILMKTA